MAEALQVTKTLQDPIEINYVPAKLLLLDHENPRFAGLIKKASDAELLKMIRKEMHLDELINSFQQNGYFNTEPLLVIESKKEKGKFTVVEGNRRLASIRLLFTPEFKGTTSSKIIDQLTNRIPVAVYPNRKTMWKYLGFRHINGPKEWDSYSKAVYALRVSTEYKVNIKDVAKYIGDTHLTIVRMCNGLRVLDQAEKNQFFSSKEVDLRRFYFSHLYTILSKENSKKFLGLTTKANAILPKNPIKRNKIKNLKLLLQFLFGDEEKGINAVIRSQNPDLKNLDAVLGDKDALRYLMENAQDADALDTALSFVDKEGVALQELVYKALNTLRKINGVAYKYKGDQIIYDEMLEIKILAEKIIEELRKKKR